MKKIFVILIVFLAFTSKAQKQDTFYFYHGDTVIQSVRTVTTVDKPLIITPGKEKFKLWYVLDVYKNDSSKSYVIDSFIPNKWPAGFLTGTRYKKLTTYRSIPQNSGISAMIGDDPVTIKIESVPNYFFLISLGIGFLLLIPGYFIISQDYKEHVPTWRHVINWIVFTVILSFIDVLGFVMSMIFLGAKYYPLNEIILVSSIHLICSLILFRMIRRRYAIN